MKADSQKEPAFSFDVGIVFSRSGEKRSEKKTAGGARTVIIKFGPKKTLICLSVLQFLFVYYSWSSFPGGLLRGPHINANESGERCLYRKMY